MNKDTLSLKVWPYTNLAENGFVIRLDTRTGVSYWVGEKFRSERMMLSGETVLYSSKEEAEKDIPKAKAFAETNYDANVIVKKGSHTMTIASVVKNLNSLLKSANDVGAVPKRPDVKEPTVWSNAVQDILKIAIDGAIASFDTMDAHALGSIANNLGKRKHLDEEQLKNYREFYERVIFFINKAKPGDGGSQKGLPVDRAEARLRLWENMYDKQS